MDVGPVLDHRCPFLVPKTKLWRCTGIHIAESSHFQLLRVCSFRPLISHDSNAFLLSPPRSAQGSDASCSQGVGRSPRRPRASCLTRSLFPQPASRTCCLPLSFFSELPSETEGQSEPFLVHLLTPSYVTTFSPPVIIFFQC